jgi:signal transduction histidine kinase
MDPWQDDVQDVTLQAAAGFLSRTVSQDLKVLRQGIGPDSPLMDALDQALQAVDDFSFYAASPPEESWTEENLASVVQEAVRDYTKETRVPVRVHPPAEAVTVRVRRQALQDAVFMVLTNAGLFSGGRPIDVHMEAHPPRGFAIHIRDGGPGFTPEALERAVEPFWSTDSRGLGLGLPYVRRRVALLKGDLSLRNRPDGGGEVSLSFPEGGAPSAQ